MEIKHTPGPWLLNGFYIYRDGATRIAAVSNWCISGADAFAETVANARLIAAAPELLEALIEVTATLAWNAHGECRAIHDGPIMPSSQAIEVARAAIAKAKGEEP